VTGEPRARVDAHHHIWWLDRTPWLAGPQVPRIFGDYDGIRRDYPAAEFDADAAAGSVTASVYVQINVAPADAVHEVQWVADAADDSALLNAVVSFADLADDRLAGILDRQAESGPLRGVRQQLHWHRDPVYRFASAPDLMLDPRWQRGLRLLGERGLLFEAQVFPSQLADLTRAVDAAPDVPIVLLHAGMPEDTTPDGWRLWESGLTELARRPNVHTKLSGLGTFARRCDVEVYRPVIGRTVEIFGPDRCMFGSNFPIEKLWTSYAHLVEVFDSCVADYSDAERDDILTNVATRLYRPDASTPRR
jgi:predicted TIM-barrel fold metal-dependent hydrolase